MREQVGLKAPWVYGDVKKLNPSPGSVPVKSGRDILVTLACQTGYEVNKFRAKEALAIHPEVVEVRLLNVPSDICAVSAPN